MDSPTPTPPTTASSWSTHRRSTHRRSAAVFGCLRWLALVPIVAALPLLFFGLLWFAAVQTLSGILLLILASTIWMLFDWLRERSR